MKQQISVPVWKKVVPADKRFARPENLVAGYTLTDYIDGSEEDCAPVIQQLLDELGKVGGGALYIPAGEYTCRSCLKVPSGVTLMGDWEVPDGKSAVEGTILVYRGPTKEDGFNQAFVELSQSALVRDLAFWYPEQNVEAPIAYPASVRVSFWATAKELTFINSWIGVDQVPCDSPTIHAIYGTALHIGIYDTIVTDIMRIEETHFSPDYWIHSGKFDGCEKALRHFLKTTATGVWLERTDWSYYTDSTVSGYWKGLVCNAGGCYGQIYNIHIDDCYYAIYAPFTHGNGQEVTASTFTNCEYGLYVPAQSVFCAFTFSDVEFHVAKQAISLNWPCKITLVDSVIRGGVIAANTGMLAVINTAFETDDAVKVILRRNAAVNLCGNTGLAEQNVSCTGDGSEYHFDAERVPTTPIRLNEDQARRAYTVYKKPACEKMYIASEMAKSLGVTLDATAKVDAAPALNAILSAIGENGGSLYLPAGQYLLAGGSVQIPAGVELCGALDIMQMPANVGTVLQVTHTDKAFVLHEASGIRAVTFVYSEQTGKDLVKNRRLKAYDFAVYAKDAADVYAINVSAHNAYSGVLFDGCDRHYVEGVGGCYFNDCTVVKNSRDGIVRDCQINAQGLSRGYGFAPEVVFRGCEGAQSLEGDEEQQFKGDCARLFRNHQQGVGEMFVLDNVQNEVSYGCFTYGGAKALVIRGDETTAVLVGFAGDYVTQCVHAEAGKQIDMINTQMTPMVYSHYTYDQFDEIYGVYLTDTFKGTVSLNNTEIWTQPQALFRVDGGMLNICNLNTGCGVFMANTHVDRVDFALLDGGKLNATALLQYNRGMKVLDNSVANAGFCGSPEMLGAKNMMASREK